MTPSTPRFTGALAALAALTVCVPAWAGPGDGIKLGGQGRLHPYLELETRWDSNAQFQGSSSDTAIALHIRPGLTISAPGDKIAIEGQANLDWQQYITGENTDDLDKLFADAKVGVGVNRKGVVGLEVADTFRRSTTTSSLTFGSAVISNENILDVAVPWRPGGGAVAVTVSGTWLTEAFEPYGDCAPTDPLNASCTEEDLRGLGYDDLRGRLEAKWRFLPRTALVVDGDYGQRTYNDPTLSPTIDGWRANVGFVGLVTPHIAATLKGGWGSASGLQSLGTWLLNAEVEWLPTFTTSARLGYLHDWGGDPGTPYSLYTTHRLYATAQVLLAGRWTAALRGQLEALSYESSAGTNNIVEVEPTLDYALSRWANLGVGYKYSKRNTDIPNQPTGYAYDFTKNELWLRVRGTY